MTKDEQIIELLGRLQRTITSQHYEWLRTAIEDIEGLRILARPKPVCETCGGSKGKLTKERTGETDSQGRALYRGKTIPCPDCQKPEAELEKLKKFALVLVEGDEKELEHLDYWAEEYLHAYEQLTKIGEIEAELGACVGGWEEACIENERLKAKYEQLEEALRQQVNILGECQIERDQLKAENERLLKCESDLRKIHEEHLAAIKEANMVFRYFDGKLVLYNSSKESEAENEVA